MGQYIPELKIPDNHCSKCPTLCGILHGHDPESFSIITSESWLRSLEEDGLDRLHCPWRNADCVVYPVEIEWAKQCFDRGITPPVRLAPRFQDEPD